MKNRITYFLALIYLCILFWIIVFKFNVPFSYTGTKRNVNLDPYTHTAVSHGSMDFGEIALNILIFIPLGVYAGLLFRKLNILLLPFIFAAVSLLCEGLQYYLAIGVFDITDIINNTIGAILGLIFFKIIAWLGKNPDRVQLFINIIGAAGTVAICLLLFYLKLNHLWVFRATIYQ